MRATPHRSYLAATALGHLMVGIACLIRVFSLAIDDISHPHAPQGDADLLNESVQAGVYSECVETRETCQATVAARRPRSQHRKRNHADNESNAVQTVHGAAHGTWTITLHHEDEFPFTAACRSMR